MRAPWVGLSLMPNFNFYQTIQPLFEANLVDVLEWSVEMGWGQQPLPPWCDEVLSIYGECDRLLGHGVHYSLLSAQQDSRQWLDRLDSERYRYRHLTEHFGWMVAGDFIQGAPLPLPLNATTLAIGQTRLQQLAEVAQVPVGLENLAFAFHRHDVLAQGEFLAQLLDPVDGFVLLDLHNLYCQMCNFQMSADEILQTYPLEKVRELHLSGGSWDQRKGCVVRRDTHDQAIPEEVFELLEMALSRCINVDFVIVERLGQTLTTALEQQQFQAQFRRIYDIVDAQSTHGKDSLPNISTFQVKPLTEHPITVDDVAQFQSKVLQAFHTSQNVEDATSVIRCQKLEQPLEQYLFHAQPEMLELAQHLVKKWGVLRQ